MLLSNVQDVDHEAIYFWTKAAFDVWPRTIQLATEREKAVVQIPLAGKLGQYA